MRVVVFGAWYRNEQVDFKMLTSLLDDLKRRYPGLIVIASGCDRGVGKLVKQLCMPPVKGQPGDVNFVEISVRIYAEDLNKATVAGIFQSRNASLFELGEEFHIFLDGSGKGMAQDLLDRVKGSGKPYAIYDLHEKVCPKVATPGPHKGD